MNARDVPVAGGAADVARLPDHRHLARGGLAVCAVRRAARRLPHRQSRLAPAAQAAGSWDWNEHSPLFVVPSVLLTLACVVFGLVLLPRARCRYGLAHGRRHVRRRQPQPAQLAAPVAPPGPADPRAARHRLAAAQHPGMAARHSDRPGRAAPAGLVRALDRRAFAWAGGRRPRLPSSSGCWASWPSPRRSRRRRPNSSTSTSRRRTVLAENLPPDGRLRFDHLGVLVPDLAHGRRLLSSVLGVSCWTVEFEDPVNDVFVQFGRCPGGMCYETVAPRSALSPVRNALKRRVNVFNHVAYRVGEPREQAACLRAAGFGAIAEPTAGGGLRQSPHPVLRQRRRLAGRTDRGGGAPARLHHRGRRRSASFHLEVMMLSSDTVYERLNRIFRDVLDDDAIVLQRRDHGGRRRGLGQHGQRPADARESSRSSASTCRPARCRHCTMSATSSRRSCAAPPDTAGGTGDFQSVRIAGLAAAPARRLQAASRRGDGARRPRAARCARSPPMRSDAANLRRLSAAVAQTRGARHLARPAGALQAGRAGQRHPRSDRARAGRQRAAPRRGVGVRDRSLRALSARDPRSAVGHQPGGLRCRAAGARRARAAAAGGGCLAGAARST